MTFSDIQTEVAAQLNLTSTEATTRIGRMINLRYRRVVSSLGLDTTKRSTTTVNPSVGSALITVSSFNKVTRVTETANSYTPLEEKTWEEIREAEQPSSDDASAWAVKTTTGTGVVLEFDVTFASTSPTFRIDGYATTSDLSGSNVPVFSQDFHDILVWGVMADELLKQEKFNLAKHAEGMFEKRLSELRRYLAISLYIENRNQNGRSR